MSRHIPDERLDVIHLQLANAFRKTPGAWVYDHRGQAICDAHDVIAALDELRMRRATKTRVNKGAFPQGKTSQILASMKVGEKVEIEARTMGALTSARGTARKMIGDPYAVWQSRILTSGLQEITRMPSGTPANAKHHNPAVFLMAKMNVGDVVVLDSLKGKMHNGIKIQARRIMDSAEANWRCSNLKSGHVRCRRVK